MIAAVPDVVSTWVQIVGGIMAIIASVAAALHWWSKKQDARLDEKLDTKLAPLVEQVQQINDAVNHVEPGEPRLIDQVRLGRERIDRLERGQSDTQEMIAGLTNAQSQTTAALSELVAQHAARKARP